MPYVVTITPANGDLMDDKPVQNEVDLAYEWLNGGVVAADVQANSLASLELFKPEFRGFPTNDVQAVSQLVGSRAVVAEASSGWASKRQRSDIFPQMENEDGWVKVPGMEWTGFIPQNSRLEVLATWEAVEIHDTSAGAVSPFPAAAGYFVVMYRERSAGVTEGEIAHTRRDLFALDNGNLALYPNFSTYGFKNTGATPGTVWDIWLAYNVTGAHLAIHQVLIGSRSFDVEVLHDN